MNKKFFDFFFSYRCIYREMGVSRRLAVRMGKRSACCFPFAMFGDDGFLLKAKIITILVNFPKGFLWYGISICFGMHDLTICIYHQLVMTYFLSLFGKDFWSKKLRSVFREWRKIENSLLFLLCASVKSCSLMFYK